jgi:hypothetical protein
MNKLLKMNDNMIREYVKGVLNEAISSVAGVVIDIPQSGDNYGLVPGEELTDLQKLQMKRLSARIYESFNSSRTGVGDVFEDLVSEIYGGDHLNRPGEADYKFADIAIGNDLYSVKGSKNISATTGVNKSRIKVSPLISLILEDPKNTKNFGIIMTSRGKLHNDRLEYILTKSNVIPVYIIEGTEVNNVKPIFLVNGEKNSAIAYKGSSSKGAIKYTPIEYSDNLANMLKTEDKNLTLVSHADLGVLVSTNSWGTMQGLAAFGWTFKEGTKHVFLDLETEKSKANRDHRRYKPAENDDRTEIEGARSENMANAMKRQDADWRLASSKERYLQGDERLNSEELKNIVRDELEQWFNTMSNDSSES